MFPEAAIKMSFAIGGLFLIISLMSLFISWKGLLVYRRRIFYIPVFLSSMILIYAITINASLVGTSFTITPEYGTVYELVHTTNPILLENLRSVESGLDTVRFRLFHDNSFNTGEYMGAYRTIQLTEPAHSELWAIEFTWWHELAHHIWQWHLLPEERDIWAGIWEKDTYIVSSGEFPYFPTDYSSTSVGEDFAESFARWVFENDDPTFHMGLYRTENLDPERKYMLILFFRRILNETCTSNYVVDCIHEPWVVK